MADELRLRIDSLHWREVHGQIVVLPAGGGEFVVNRAGAVLWTLLDQGVDRDQLRGRLVEAFEIAEAQAEQDLDAFLAALRSRDLLEG